MKHSVLWWLLIGWWWICVKIVFWVTFGPFILIYKAAHEKPKRDFSWIDRAEEFHAFMDD